MSKHRAAHWTFLSGMADFFIFLIAFAFGCLTRHQIQIYGDDLFDRFDYSSLATLFFIFYSINMFLFSRYRVYSIARRRTFDEAVTAYFKSNCMAFAVILAMAYLITPLKISRLLLLSATSYAFVLLYFKEKMLRWHISRTHARGSDTRHVLVVSQNEEIINKIIKEVIADPLLGFRVVGIITPRSDERTAIAGFPIMGDLSGLQHVIEKEIVDCVIFSNRNEQIRDIEDHVWCCEERGLEVWMMLSFFESNIRRIRVEKRQDISFLSLRSGPSDVQALMVKYLMDRVCSGILLLAVLPVMLIVALLIKVGSKGPILFRQHRAGINGRKFVCYKFRTMVNNAEQLKEELLKSNEMKGPAFKMKNDPRITPIGRILRKTSIDELPQLWNVFVGDMSLVGPRAMCFREASHVTGWNRRRFSMKPGITCIWQVTGRNRITDFNEWAKLDLEYIDKWNLFLDIKILIQTIGTVLKCTGQ